MKMNDFIKRADALKESELMRPVMSFNTDAREAVDVGRIIALPDADVEEVIRCKDCKFRFSETCAFKHETADMDYCSCGAKFDEKENEDV